MVEWTAGEFNSEYGVREAELIMRAILPSCRIEESCPINHEAELIMRAIYRGVVSHL